MLESITLRNFQCHKKLTVKLDPYVTVIKGSNDVGKSAIIRALRLACLNKPIGKSFIRHKQSQASVTLKVDGHTVVRKIGKLNAYKLDDQVYRSFRSDVPSAIKDLLSIDEINFQQQHEPVFWFSMPPGQVAKELNKLIDLDAIDKSQTIIARKLRHATTALDVCRDRIQLARSSAQSLAWTRQANVKLGKLNRLISRLAVKSHQMARMALLINQAIQCDERLKAAAAAREAASVVVGAGRAAVTGQARLARLASVSGAVEAVSGAVGPVPKLNRVGRIKALHEKKQIEIERLKKLLAEIRIAKQMSWNHKQKVELWQAKLNKKLNGRCPVCGGFLTTEFRL